MQWPIHYRKIIYGLIILLLIYFIIFRRRSPQLLLTATEVQQFTSPEAFNTTQTYRIPRIIHQTWKTTDVPAHWNHTVESVRRWNQNQFEYHVWTDNEMHEFVRREYPSLYQNTFIKYPLNIQRVDAFRYIILYHMGGVYIDMDNGCRQSFESLLYTLEAMDPHINHIAAFPRTTPVGISNGFMITTKSHPLFEILVSRLSLFNRNFLVDYLTVMLSAGPLYLSVNEFYFNQMAHHSRVRIIDEQVYSSIYTWHTPGNSWHGRDAKIILKIYHTWRRKYEDINFNYVFIFLLFLLILFYVRRQRRRSSNFSYFYCFRKMMFCRKSNTLRIKPSPI